MIPKKAKKVFQGIIYSVWQWEQKMFDGSIETFERLKRCDSVSVIAITPDKKIIYLEQKQPDQEKAFGSLPGGRIDHLAESSLLAGQRELLEETGYQADNWKEFSQIQSDHKIERIFWTYIAQGAKKISKQNLDAGEKIKVKLITLDELLDLADQKDFRHLDIQVDLVRAKYSKKDYQELKKKLFN